jgi:hypothetical protein
MGNVGRFHGGREVYATLDGFGEAFELMNCDAQVTIASESGRTAVEKAKAAQPRSGVLMKFFDFVSRDLNSSFRQMACARTRHDQWGCEGGYIQRGVEVTDFSGSISRLLMDAHTESAGAEHAG